MTQRNQKKPPAKTGPNLTTLWWILGGVVGLALIVLLAISIAGEEELDDSIAFGDVSIEGEPLPVLEDPTNDPAIGMTAATISGGDWNDNQYSIGPDGTPKIVVFLAHWCSHCQAEVPVINQWLNSGGLPDGVEMYSVTVFSDRLRGNWPPQAWLEDAGWTVPVIMDDAIGTVATTVGMTGTPLYIVLDGENKVVQRVSGEIGAAGLDTLSQLALASAT